MRNRSYYKDGPEYCHYFFDLVETDNLALELEKSRQFTLDIFRRITPEKEHFAYAPHKWTTKQVLRHIIDCERVYTCRALRFSRFDATELPGFEQDEYIKSLKSMDFQLADLEQEYLAVRAATATLFKTMTEEMLDFKGIANNVTFTPRAIGFMTVGHNLHHIEFIKRNYLGL